MSKIEQPTNIYIWLRGLGLIKSDSLTENFDNKITLDVKDSQDLEYGVTLLKQAEKICEQRKLSFCSPTMTKSAYNPTKVTKIINWDNIIKAYRGLGFMIDISSKEQVIHGDIRIIEDIVKLIYEKYAQKIDMYSPVFMPNDNNIQSNSHNFNDTQDINNLSKMLDSSKLIRKNFPSVNRSMPNMLGDKSIARSNMNDIDMTFDTKQLEPVNIDYLEKNVSLEKVDKLLEFLILSQARSLKISARNAVTFFAYKGKLLANMIIKGLKGNDNFLPQISWYNTLQFYKEKIFMMINQDQSHTTMYMFLGVIKPGLISKSYDVAKMAVKMFSKMFNQFHERFQLNWAYEWFISDQGAQNDCVLAIKRHTDLKPKIFGLIKIVSAEDNFINQLKKFREKFDQNEHFYSFQHKIQTPMLEDSDIITEIEKAHLDELWIKSIVENFIKRKPYDQGLYFGQCFMIDWFEFKGLDFIRLQNCDLGDFLRSVYSYLIESPNTKKYHLQSIKGGMTDIGQIPMTNAKLAYITQQFRLFDILNGHPELEKEQKTQFVHFFEIIYQYGVNNTVRDFTCSNLSPHQKKLKPTLDQHMSLYLRFLKKYVTENMTLNFTDQALMRDIIFYCTIPIRFAGPLQDSLTAIFFTCQTTAPDMAEYMAILAEKYIGETKMKEYCVLISKIALNKYLALERKRRKPIGYFENYRLDPQSGSNKEVVNEMVNLQKKSQILKFLNDWLQIGDKFINNNLKWLITYTNLLYKNHQKDRNQGFKYLPNNKGMLYQLTHFGDPEDLIKKNEIEAEYRIVTGSVASLDDVYRDLDTNIVHLQSIKANKNLYNAKTQMSKERMFQLAMKRGVKADPRIFVYLEQVQKKNDEKADDIRISKENKENRQNEQYTNARDLLNARRIEHGIADYNLKDVEGKLLWPLDSLPREKAEYKLVDMIDFEDINQEAVKGVMKKYGRLFKTYFIMYLNTTCKIGVDNPDEGKRITKSSLQSFIKDYKLDVMLNLEDVSDIVRLINSELCNSKGEINSLNYDGFKHFIIQISQKVFSEAANLPPSFAIRAQINHLEEYLPEEDCGKISKLFSDPEYAGYDDADVIHYLNEHLAEDKEYEVPDTFTTQKRTDVNYFFEQPDVLEVPERWKICYEILDDIVSDNFGVHFMEPYPDAEEITYAKPRIFFTSLQNKKPLGSIDKDGNIVEKSCDQLEKKPTNYSHSENYLMFTDPRIKLSTNMKLEITNYEMKDKPYAKQCAFVLEELQQKTEAGDEDPTLHTYQLKQVQNKAIKDQDRKKEDEQKFSKERDEKIKQRADIVKEHQQDLRDDKKKKEDEVKKIEKEKAKAARIAAEKEAKIAAKREKALKKQVDKERKEREKNEERKRKELRKKRRTDRSRKKKDFENWNASQIKKWKKDWTETVKDRKKNTKEQTSEKENFHSNLLEKNNQYNDAFVSQKEALREKKQTFEDKVTSFIESKALKNFMRKYEKSLKKVFDWYAGLTKTDIYHPEQCQLLQLNQLSMLFSQWNLYPSIVNRLEMTELYNSIIFHKDNGDSNIFAVSIDKHEVVTDKKKVTGLDWDKFLKLLVKFSCRNKDKFQKIVFANSKKTTTQQDGTTVQNSDETEQDNSRDNSDKTANDELEEDEIEEAEALTEEDLAVKEILDGLVNLMELSSDPNKTNEKLQKIQSEYKAKPNRAKIEKFYEKMDEPIGKNITKRQSSPNVSKIKIKTNPSSLPNKDKSSRSNRQLRNQDGKGGKKGASRDPSKPSSRQKSSRDPSK